MRFILTADIPVGVHRPGVPLAQVLREIQPVVENASPLVSGRLTDRLTGATRAEWVVQELLSLSPDPVAAPGATHFVLTADVTYDIHEPGLAIAQILREVEPVIETMNPLVPGFLRDRLTAEIRADWLVGTPVVTAPIVTAYSPNPAPVEAAFGMSLTGNWFPLDAVVYFDRVPTRTDVYSQWSITGTGPALPAGTHEVMLVCSGLGYCHFHWEFANPVDAPTLTSIDPTTVPVAANAGTPMTVKLFGTNFTVNSVGVIDGVPAVTQFMSAEDIRASFNTPTVPGTLPVLARTPGFPDTASFDLVFEAAAEQRPA